MSKAVLDEKGNLFMEEMEETGCKVFVDSRNWQELLYENERKVFRINEGELARTFVIPKENGYDLFFMIHHITCDGNGILVFAEDVFERAAVVMLEFIADMREQFGYTAKVLDLGGGYGVRYVDSDPYLDIETNGINLEKLQRYITAFCDVTRVNISWSPKFINEESKDYNYDLLLKLKNTNDGLLYPMPTLKLVVGKDDMNDYNQFAYDAVIKYGYDPNKIYLMPKGTTLDEINESMKYLLDIASDIKCNVSSRLHVIHNFK
jgi:hypothetical protein